MVGDKISNLIIGLKNAGIADHKVVSFPYTKLNHSILDVLKKEGFIDDFEKEGKDLRKKLNATLSYKEGVSAITDIKRASKQSRRVYIGYKDIRPVKNGYGMSVISTPEGVMSNKEAKKKKLGGEELFKVW
jgi:small subunit ribosomal protein S8